MITVPVRAGEGRYDVSIGSGLIDRAEELLPPPARANRAFVVSDPVAADLFGERLSGALATRGWDPVALRVPQGEEAKTLQVTEMLYRQLAGQEAHRDDVVLGLGGGAAGDLAGFVGATYMRGLHVVQVPTTLTAQVDAAIGGKTAVNLPEGKNLVGAFHQPDAVIADVDTLATLEERDLRSGLAEVAKYGLTLDAQILSILEERADAIWKRDSGVMEDLVARCVRCKASVVEGDERDTGRRLLLNYGHTLAHALERLEGYTGRSHGEAVAVGMVFAARLSEALGIGSPELVQRHSRIVGMLGLEPEGRLPGVDAVLGAFRLDKKYSGGVRFVLLEDVGAPRVVEDVPEATVRTVLEEMGAR
ncbi:MAG: 3-dehydroquinate synthase [Actinomycetota bacterium]